MRPPVDMEYSKLVLLNVPEYAEEKVPICTGAPCTIYLTGNPTVVHIESTNYIPTYIIKIDELK